MFGAIGACHASAQRGTPDPAFENVPFDQWLTQEGQTHFHWSVKVAHAELSFHQRLTSSIDIQLDGQDLDSRRHDGELLLLIQITDPEGIRYQEHGSIDLSKLDVNVKEANLNYSQSAFFLPGEYQLAVGVLDKKTGDHNTIQSQFHIAPSPNGFLREAWQSLPAVEFLGNDVSPQSWYLPYIKGHLQWASALHSPAQVNVIMNVAPSVPVYGSRRAPSSDLPALLPSLKVITQTGSASISEHVALLDLSRRHTVFDQTEVTDLDWHRLKASLEEANTASIDLHSLSGRQEEAQYFVSEVRRLLRASTDKPCVLVILTKPVSFDSGEDLEKISLEALPSCRVIYIRYHPAPEEMRPMGTRMGGRGGRRSPMNGPMMRPSQEPFDQLAATLKPLSPKVIDVESPEQMTKALSEIQKALLKSDESSR